MIELEADLRNEVVWARANGGPTASLPISRSDIDVTHFRLSYRGEGRDNTNVMLLDDVTVGPLPQNVAGRWVYFQ